MIWSAPATVIPAHNAIMFPNYWWETATIGGLALAMYLAAVTVLEWKVIYDMKYNKLYWPFSGLFLNALESWATFWCVCYLIWTPFMGYNNPMPFVGMICYVLTNFSHFITISFLFPKTQSKEEEEELSGECLLISESGHFRDFPI